MDKRYIVNEDPRGPIVNLRKYGWVASPSENFSDDGAYFTVYRYYPDGYNPDEKSQFRLTRTNYRGDTYISIAYENPKTGKNQYIDDLNGVSKQEAVDEFPQVMEKVRALYDKVKTEGHLGKDLSEADIEAMSDYLSNYSKENGFRIPNYYTALKAMLDKFNMKDEELSNKDQKEILDRASRKLRASRTFDSSVIKEIASDYLKNVMRNKDRHSLDDALLLSYGVAHTDKGESIFLHDLSDELQSKIKNWARKRIETLYDYDDLEESLSDTLFEGSYDDRMQKIDDILKGKYNYKIVGPRLYLDKKIDDDTLSEIRTLLYDGGIELGTSVGKRVYEPSYTRGENEISTTTLVSKYIKSVTAGITPERQKGITPTFRYTNGKTIKFEYAFWDLGIPSPSTFELDDDMFNELKNVVKGAVEKLKQWGVVFGYTSIGDYRGTSYIRGAWELDFLKSYVPIPEELS